MPFEAIGRYKEPCGNWESFHYLSRDSDKMPEVGDTQYDNDRPYVLRIVTVFHYLECYRNAIRESLYIRSAVMFTEASQASLTTMRLRLWSLREKKFLQSYLARLDKDDIHVLLKDFLPRNLNQ